jgi:alanine racemase
MREIQVNLGAIVSNYQKLKAEVSPSQVMAVVKANAYGHGMHEVATALDVAGVDALGVADMSEAIELRVAGIKAPLMCWIVSESDDFEMANQLEIQIGVSNFQILEKAIAHQNLIHIKVDTGLGRNGFAQTDWEELFARLSDQEVGLFSHLANTSVDDDLNQLAQFEKAMEVAESHGVRISTRHLAATAGALSYPQMRFDMVRCGIGIYGLNPWEDKGFEHYGLTPAMRVTSRIANVKLAPKGQGVSYGYRYKTTKETSLALVPFGYAEGMPRISVGAKVLIAGRLFEVSGRVAMDQFVVDVGDAEVSIGDEVVIFGDSAKGEPTAEELGASAQSINYEIVTRIGGRAKRTYL